MNFRTFLAIILILILIPAAMAAYSAFRHSAFTIGDGKDINLWGNLIGNGSIRDVACISNCTGYGITSTETNATNLTSGTVANARLTAEASNFNQSYSYFVYDDATTVYAKNGSTGKIDFSSTGSNRNYTVIQGAIDNTSLPGNTIQLSASTFILDNVTLSIPAVAGRAITLAGSGIGATRIQAKTISQTTNLLNISATGQPTVVRDMTFVSAAGGSFAVDGINVSAGNSITLKNLWISGFRHGISLDYCSDCSLSDITSELSQQNFYINASNGVKANAIYSYHADVDGAKIIDTTDSGVVGGMSITNSEFTEDAGNSIYLLNSNSSSISNSIFHNDGAAPTAIYIENGYSTLINANSFKSHTGRAIGFVGTNEVAITGNSFQYTPIGIDALSGTITNITISSNVFRKVNTTYQGSMSYLRVLGNPGVADV